MLVYACMILDLTPAIVEELQRKDYTFFIDKDNISNKEHVFTPVKETLDQYDVNQERDAVLTMNDAVQLSFDELSRHKVIMPDID
jgi:hypothetical protein